MNVLQSRGFVCGFWGSRGSRHTIGTLRNQRCFSLSKQRNKKVIIGGGTGFVGQRLNSSLKAKGHEVQIISRSKGLGRITWDEVAASGLPECQAVVNLAGIVLLDPMRRWNEQFKEDLRTSRINTTKCLADKIAEAENPPEVFVSSSAVGYYPPSETVDYTEDTPPSDANELTRLCRDWEHSAKLPEHCPTRLATVRMGVVLGKGGGLIQQAFRPFWLGLGGVIGTGDQVFPWIHIQDMCDIIIFAIENSNVTGPLNSVAPEISTNKDFTREFASALNRPAFLPVPAFAVNAIFGYERAMVMLQGQKVIPKRMIEMGYDFKFSNLKSAIANIVK